MSNQEDTKEPVAPEVVDELEASEQASEQASAQPRWRQIATSVLWVALGVLLTVLGSALLARPSSSVPDPHAGHAHAQPAGEPGEQAKVEYVCPMHPQIRQSEPGTCPICYMDLVAVESGRAGKGSDMPAVSLSESAKRLARVRTEAAEAVALQRKIEVFGRVAVNETSEVDLTAWVGGRIDRLHVNAVGERVKKGQLLARIYSPDLLNAQQTLVQASKNLADAEASASEPRARAARAALEASKTELRLLGVDAKQLAGVLADGKAREHVDIYATSGGTVRARAVSRGDWVESGGRILSLTGLETVWVQLEIYERDLAVVAVGQPVKIQVSGLAGGALEGRIDFIDPTIDEQKRVARARVVIANEDAKLRPGMFVTASIEAAMDAAQTPVSVAASAVLWTGKRSLVYRVEDHDGELVYVPVKVTLGPRVGDRYVIEEGVAGGDLVVTNGAFRIDASLQIQGGPTMMSTRGAATATSLARVEVAAGGTRFEPPVQASQLPDDVWYCDMGTVHYAQGEQGDATCPVCNMRLVHKAAADDTTNQGGGHAH
ncbi:MAG: efflux RND transporter periplasmic adaptor subunit [Bradymonadaceae bacterium]|nr:efflux RND transporter periplasmic adaptor subunit [Lujinxingiaceae bacterium]